MKEEILGIIDAKGVRLAPTTDRLIVARGSVLERIDLSSVAAGVTAGAGLIIGGAIAAIGAAVRGRKEKKEKEKALADFTPESILSMDKKNFAIPWSEVTRVEVSKESWGTEGMRFKFFTAGKKHEFAEIKGRMLGKCWRILTMTIPDKVTVPKDREKFDKDISKLENTPVDVLCDHLCSLGFEAEVAGLKEEEEPAKLMALTGYIDEGVAAIKGRNIDYILNKREMLNWGVTCILENVTGTWKFTETKKRGKEDFEWAGDSRICSVLNDDVSVKSALLEEMQAKEIDDVGILEPDENVAGIRVWPKERLPSKRLLEAIDRVAGYLRKIA